MFGFGAFGKAFVYCVANEYPTNWWFFNTNKSTSWHSWKMKMSLLLFLDKCRCLCISKEKKCFIMFSFETFYCMKYEDNFPAIIEICSRKIVEKSLKVEKSFDAG